MYGEFIWLFVANKQTSELASMVELASNVHRQVNIFCFIESFHTSTLKVKVTRDQTKRAVTLNRIRISLG